MEHAPKLSILASTASWIAIDKPSGLLVHPDPREPEAPSAMKLLRNQMGAWVFPIHRLDRATSGVLLFATSTEVAHIISTAFAERRVHKQYHAWVRGWMPPAIGVDRALARSEEHERRQARTEFFCEGHYECDLAVGRYPIARYSYVRCHPLTGRHHQIRRHLSHIRHPILADTQHGDNQHNRALGLLLSSRRLMLHASELIFPDPLTSEEIRIEATEPELFHEFRARLQEKERLIDLP